MPSNKEDLIAQYKDLCSVYGDARNRLRSLTNFLEEVETKLDDLEKLFKLLGLGQQSPDAPADLKTASLQTTS